MKQTKSYIRFLVTLSILCGLSTSAYAQNWKKLNKALEKRGFEDLKEQIEKSSQKDSAHFGNYYFWSHYYLDSSRNQYDLNLARINIFESKKRYEKATDEQLADWQKAEIAPNALDTLEHHVTYLAFSFYSSPASVQSMDTFMLLFPEAEVFERARSVRDSIAFDEALEHNTWNGFKIYFEKYPASIWTDQARELYEKLLYQDKTGSGDLKSYISYLEQYPETPYREQAEAIIFNKITLTHRTEDYIDFINRFPESSLRKHAADMIYYQYKLGKLSSLKDALSLHPEKDSLRTISTLEAKKLIPLLIDGKYHFMDERGQTLPNLTYEGIDSKYYCGNLADEWLKVQDQGEWKLVNRSGFELINEIGNVSFIGEELMLIEQRSTSRLFHKTGKLISDITVDEARVVFDEWIAFRKDLYWGLMSFNGEIVAQPRYTEIIEQGQFLIFETKDNLFGITNTQNIPNLYHDKSEIEAIYDDYETLGDSLFIGYFGEQESLINDQLEVLMPLEHHRIFIKPQMWYVLLDSTYYIFDQTRKQLQLTDHQGVLTNSNWTAFKDSTSWNIYGLASVQATVADSVHLINDEFIYYSRDTKEFLLFTNLKNYELGSKNEFQLIGPADSTGFVLITAGRTQEVLNMKGEQMFIGTKFDKVEYLNQKYLIVRYNKLYGIYELGKGYLIRPGYDLIHAGNGGLTYLVKNNKIGCLNPEDGTIIPPVYEARITAFDNQYLVVKGGLQGVVDAKNKTAIPIRFDELRTWNDTSYWGKEGDYWKLITSNGEVIMDQVSSLKPWLTNTSGQYYLFRQTDGYGIIHQKSGIIIEPKYNDIVNVGSREVPVYFAEQHLKTADFFVVTYFNSAGEPLKSQAYRPHEYENIYCDQ